jgi:hypothetical protein
MAAAVARPTLLLLACVAALCSHHGAAAQGLPLINSLDSATKSKSQALQLSSSFITAYKLVGGAAQRHSLEQQAAAASTLHPAMRTAVEMLPFDSPNASMLHDWRSRGQAAAPLNQLLHTCRLCRATPATCCRHSATGRQPAARATRALQMSAKGTPTSSPTCWISPESTTGPSRGAWASGCAPLAAACTGWDGALHAACPCRLRDHRGRHLDMKPGTSASSKYA